MKYFWMGANAAVATAVIFALDLTPGARTVLLMLTGVAIGIGGGISSIKGDK